MKNKELNPVLRVMMKNIYGRELIYPANDVAIAMAGIAGTKTLSTNQLKILKELGYHIEWVPSYVPL